MKPPRQRQAALRMVPSRQRFDADDPAGHHLDLRLVVDFELVPVERSAQLVGQRDALAHLPVEFHRMEAIAVAAFSLRAIESEIGLGQHRLRPLDLRIVEGNSGADRDVHRVAVDVEWSGHRPGERQRQHAGVRRVAQAGLEDRELVAAEPRDEIAAAHAVPETGRDQSKEAIAGRVPQRIVDVLEQVDVDVEDGKALRPAPARGERLLEPLEKGGSVGQTGQLVA